MSQSLFAQIAAAVAGEYDVVGALGASAGGSAFLARDVATGHVVVLFVPAGADALEVLAALGDEVPADAGRCTACGHAPAAWTAACPACRRPFVLGAEGAPRVTADAVQAAAAHAYDVVGEVPHLAGGSLFFVRDLADGHLVALAAQPAAGGGQVLDAVWDAAGYAAYAADAADGPGLADPGHDRASGHSAAAYETALVDDGSDAPRYAADDRARPAQHRRWAPLVGAGALVVAGGVAWAALGRDASERPVPSADSTPSASVAVGAVAGAPAAPSGQAAAGGGGSAAPSDGAGLAARPDERAPAGGATREPADSARAPRPPAVVELDGGLPAGWTWRVNGRPGPSSLRTRLRPGRPAFLEIEAPGYCPDTLRLADPQSGSVQRWAPRLRGKPMVGEC